MSLRQTLFSTSGSGTVSSLGALGVNTGAVGAASGGDDTRAFGGEQPRGLETDAAGRARDEADGAVQLEIHGSLA